MNRAEAQYVFPDEGDNQLLEGSIYGLSLYFWACTTSQALVWSLGIVVSKTDLNSKGIYFSVVEEQDLIHNTTINIKVRTV